MLLMADPVFPAPPTHYGGIDRLIDMLAHGLADSLNQLLSFNGSPDGTRTRHLHRATAIAEDRLKTYSLLTGKTRKRA